MGADDVYMHMSDWLSLTKCWQCIQGRYTSNSKYFHWRKYICICCWPNILGHVVLSRVNLLAIHDAMWHHKTWSTLAQVMAWCHQAPSHYLSQCWLLIHQFQWHSLEETFTRSLNRILKITNIKFQIYKISDTSTSGQRTKACLIFKLF